MKIALAALALLLAMVSRAADWDRLEGSRSGVKQRTAIAIQDARQWEALWSRHDGANPAPAVDFSKESVIAVFLGERRAAGVKVEIVIQKDPIDGSRLNVFYREAAGGKPFSASVICQPYAIVKVPRAAAIGLEHDGRVSIPEDGLTPGNPYDGRKVRALVSSLSTVSFD